MYFELSGDDDICSNYMSFRILGSKILSFFDFIFHKNDGGCEKVET